MKKLLSLLLAAALLLSLASFATAESFGVEGSAPTEETAKDGTVFPYFLIGLSPAEVVSNLQARWSEGYVALSAITEGTRTLEDGKEVRIYDMTGEGNEYNGGIKIGIRLYESEGIIIAGVFTLDVPEGQDPGRIRDFYLINSFGQPAKLSMDRLGIYGELLGEDAMLENGIDQWRYELYSAVPGTEVNYATVAKNKIIVTYRVVDDKVYIAAFPDIAGTAASGAGAGGVSLADLKGYDKLTQEQKVLVSSYADYLASKDKTELEGYIAFLTKDSE